MQTSAMNNNGHRVVPVRRSSPEVRPPVTAPPAPPPAPVPAPPTVPPPLTGIAPPCADKATNEGAVVGRHAKVTTTGPMVGRLSDETMVIDFSLKNTGSDAFTGFQVVSGSGSVDTSGCALPPMTEMTAVALTL